MVALTDLIVHFRGVVLLRPPSIDLADGGGLLGSEPNKILQHTNYAYSVCRIKLEQAPGLVLGLYSLTGRHPVACPPVWAVKTVRASGWLRQIGTSMSKPARRPGRPTPYQ